MLIRSTRFGEIEVPEDEIINFPYGLPGFMEEKAFAFLPCEEDNPFAFLQSVTEPNLTFIVVEPFSFFKEYEFELNDQIASELGLDASNPPQILNIVSMPDKPETMTANLLAPVIINVQSRKAVQFVLEKTSYTTKHPLFPEGLLQQSDKGGK